MTPPALIVHRDAVRLLMVDADDRLLLQHCITPDTGTEFWCTPGGAIHEAESPDDAARRELFEEEGIDLDVRLAPPVWERLHVFATGDGRVFHQRERYHVLRVAAFDPVPGALSTFEHESIIEQRWWALGDLRGADPALLNPPELPALLAEVIA
ncbi:MAG TPA: NUDIX domain-containing protein [Candidatus Dormibacteraeota bacterium]